HPARGVDVPVPLHRLLPGLGDEGGDDLPSGFIHLEGLPCPEVAGQRTEADLEALLAVDETGDGLAGPGRIALGEGFGDLAQVLDRVRYIQAELIESVLSDQHSVTGQRLLEGHSVEDAVEAGGLDDLGIDGLEVLELLQERL